MKVLLAVDGSAYTRKMLTYLTTHPELLAEATSMTVLNVQTELPAHSRLSAADRHTYHEAEAEKVLDPLLKRLARHYRQPAKAWEAGPPGDTIAKYAERGKFDLIVMGSKGQSALRNLVMGSVATRVLAQCQVPVLLVR